MIRLNKMSWLLLTALLFATGCVSANKSGTAEIASPDMQALSIEAAQAYSTGEGEKSLALYRQLIEQNPTNHEYINNLGVLMLDVNRNEEALDAFEKASILAPGNPDYLVNAGFAQIRLQEFDDAEAFFDRALQLAPRHALALYGKGVLFIALNEPEIAYSFFLRSVEIDPTNTDSLFMKGFAAQKNGLWEDAAKDFTAFIGLSRNKGRIAQALSNRALCYFHQKRYKEGLEDLDEAITLNDRSAVLYYNRGVGYQALHKYEQAVQDYTRAITRKVAFPEAYINRGELNYLIGKETKGCADLKRACEFGFCEVREQYEMAGKCED